MKTVKVKPFGVLKVADSVLKSVQNNTYSKVDTEKALTSAIKEIRKSKVTEFVGIIPDTKELFKFIPIIEDDQLFAARFPDPIQLYFSLAFTNYQFSKQTRYNITLQKNKSLPLNFINEYLYNWHLQYKISTIIFLHSTVEAFINYIMPEDFIYKQLITANASDKFLTQTKELNKEQTERFIQFKEKLKHVVTQLTGINFQETDQKTYDSLLSLNTLRNDLIHLRSTLTKNQQHFEKAFDSVVNIDLEPFVNSVKDFINTITPNFIEFQEQQKETNDAEIVFKFENYSAFRFDISVFLKILDTPSKTVKLIIPKSTDTRFQRCVNWIMQNLDVMAKDQLIYFPTIDDTPDTLSITVLKTDRQLGNNPVWDK